MEMFDSSCSIIAGSFILQCLLNQSWESDIFIFVPIDNKIVNLLSQKYNLEEITHGEIFDKYEIKCVKIFSKIKNLKYNFQVIIVNVQEEEIANFMTKNFNLNIFQKNKLSKICYEEVFSKKIKHSNLDLGYNIILVFLLIFLVNYLIF